MNPLASADNLLKYQYDERVCICMRLFNLFVSRPT